MWAGVSDARESTPTTTTSSSPPREGGFNARDPSRGRTESAAHNGMTLVHKLPFPSPPHGQVSSAGRCLRRRPASPMWAGVSDARATLQTWAFPQEQLATRSNLYVYSRIVTTPTSPTPLSLRRPAELPCARRRPYEETGIDAPLSIVYMVYVRGQHRMT